jgi:hypothetical protein
MDWVSAKFRNVNIWNMCMCECAILLLNKVNKLLINLVLY